jgi:hypothetical protein
MRVKYHYPVKSNIPLPKKRPIKVEKYFVELSEENGRVNSIAVSATLYSTARLPTFVAPNDAKVDIAIDAGDAAFSPAVQDFLITVQGTLSLLGQFSIDLSTCKTEFIPESEEEKSKITINNYRLEMGKPVVNDAVPLPSEDLAQIISAAPELSDYQVPLSFIRRGIEDMGQDRYVEAFYNFSFFSKQYLLLVIAIQSA